jgi:hypothetical protein
LVRIDTDRLNPTEVIELKALLDRYPDVFF